MAGRDEDRRVIRYLAEIPHRLAKSERRLAVERRETQRRECADATRRQIPTEETGAPQAKSER